jgi:hypothetical protein
VCLLWSGFLRSVRVRWCGSIGIEECQRRGWWAGTWWRCAVATVAASVTRADIPAVLVRAGNGGVVKIPLGKRMDRLTAPSALDTAGSDFACPSVALLLVLRAVPTPGGVACHRLCAGQPDRGNRALVVLQKREICFRPEGHRVVDHIRQ